MTETKGSYTTNTTTSTMTNLRLSGTPGQLETWIYLLRQLEAHNLATIYEISAPYKNRGESKIFRQYIKADLNIPSGIDLFKLPPGE